MGIFFKIFFGFIRLNEKTWLWYQGLNIVHEKLHLVENRVLTGMVKVSSAVGADTIEIYRRHS